jgi:ribosomal protein S18 acetylase RimI-like enzyme
MENELESLTRLDRSQVKPAAEVMARAFRYYPFLKFFYPDDAKRKRVTRYFSLIATYYGEYYGELYAPSPKIEGVAIWIHSSRYKMSLRSLLRAVPLHTLLAFSFTAGGKMQEAGEYVDTIHKRLAPFDHWYLSVLGVDPQYQGKGYSSQLMRPALARANREKLPCYLETNDEKDVQIYLHFGFKVLEEETLPGTAVKNWAMLREAR